MSLFSTQREYDAGMVARYISDNELDDTLPTTLPDAVTSGSVTVTADTYSWGKVFYAEHHDDNRGATWIERNDVRPSLPPWIEDVRTLVDRPSCLGFHEGDHVCDGGINPNTGVRERPCRWREICMKVQKTVGDPGQVDRYLNHHSDSELWDMVESRPKARSTKLSDRQKVARSEQRVTSADNLESSRELAMAIFRRACEIGGWPIAVNRWRAAIGQYLAVEYDRETRNPLITIYRRRPRSLRGEIEKDVGTEQAIATLLPHSRDDMVSAQINTNAVEVVRGVAVGLHIVNAMHKRSYIDQHIVTIRNITSDDVDVVAQAIVSIVEGGHLNTFGLRTTDPEKPKTRNFRRMV